MNLAAVIDKGMAHLVDMNDRGKGRRRVGPRGVTNAITVDRYVVMVLRDCRAAVYDAQSLRQVRRIGKSDVQSIDGHKRILLISYRKGVPEAYNVCTGKPLRTIAVKTAVARKINAFYEVPARAA